MDFSEVKIGDFVLISTPHAIASTVEREAVVTAVHRKSFDAGGFCFRKDGTEWWGRYRADFICRKDTCSPVNPAAGNGAANGLDAPVLPVEEVTLPIILSSRSESEWLSLGLAELRKIVAQFKMQPMGKTGSAQITDFADMQ